MNIDTRTRINALCLMAALAIPTAMSPSAQAPTAERRFEAARQQEEIQGDLKGAIEAYERLASGKDTPRPLAASALLRVADCYRKLGDQKARDVYARIVRDFPDQKAAYATALAQVSPAKASHDPRIRTVWTGPNVDLFGQVSPDGTLLTYTDWTTAGNLMVHDLRTGADRALTHKKTWDDGHGYANWSTVSRDGKQVAYHWELKDRQELRILPLAGDGSSPRIVFSSEEVTFLSPYDWSPDGQWVAAGLSRKDGSGQVALIGVKDGALRVLRTTDWQGPQRIFFSRDDRFVAFDQLGGDDQVQRDIVVMAVDASRAVTAVKHQADDRLMGWSPDGANLIFTSDRTGDVGLWALPMADGAPAGTPTLLRPSVGGAFSLGITDAGNLLVHKGVSTRDVRVASLDLKAGRIHGARSFDRGFLDGTRVPTWSPDGRSLAYQACGGECIAIRSVSTGAVRRIPSFYSVDPRWSPDGNSFVTAARDLRGRNGIFRVDATTGSATPLVLGPPFGAMPQWSRDGQAVYYRTWAEPGAATNNARNGTRILRWDVIRQENSELVDLPGLEAFDVSPDGRWIVAKSRDAATNTSKLLLMPAEGGTLVEWLSAAPGEDVGGMRQLAWTPDSAGVLFTKRTGTGVEIWHAPRHGQASKLTVDVEGWPEKRLGFNTAFSLSPDGRSVAFLTGNSAQEVWALEHMLPASSRGSQARR